MSEIQTHYRTCNICEAMCGIEIKHQGTEIISIKPDQQDPFSRGHICPKAVALQDYYHDPERLKTPMRKTDSGWQPISWEDAFTEIGTKMRAIQQQHGADSVGVYLGNPNAHNFGNAIFLPHFFKALGSKSRFSSASADQMPHHVAANYVLGSGMAISVPDINRTDFMLIIGGNPVVSNGSMMSGAGMPDRIKAIQQRGGKVVVVDPRRTETAKIASEHLFIRPEKDALLLMAMIHSIIENNLGNLRHLQPIIEGYQQVVSAAAEFSPETVADTVGISASQIHQLAQDFANAPSAVCYSRMGASTQSFGGLCQWLTLVLNIITGNFDRAGGAMFPQPAFDLLRTVKPGKPNSYGRHQSRVRKLPFFNGEFPIAALAEEITTEGEGQIKAMFCIAGNPVLSAPNGDGLDKAFEQLDFMVAVDIYLNETTKHADIILPATTGLEVAHFDVFFNSFAVSNTVKYSPPLFDKTPEQKHDWEILKNLASCLTGAPDDGSTPEFILDMTLKSGHYKDQEMSLKKLQDNPHGIDLGPLQPCAKERIKTADGSIQLAPEFFLQDLPRLRASLQEDAAVKAQFPFDLVSRRLVRNHNTWTHNAHRLIKGKNPVTLQLHSQDAEALNISAGQKVRVQSATGQVQIDVEINDDMLPGVVSIPQGWGHDHKNTGMSVAAQQPGVSINSLTDHRRVDLLTGNAAFNGTPVRIEAA
ncbi:molybdopterin-dependent oxidoreductase [Aestuariirhabdus sp. Z084]|uniref:molybdopterin-dependent oxidoreductase n=1 Tax=Aestuariirhabdus haliotis TaxID=2918751 RepID=UPI00201B3813|nr:molybdopterin-dependent oxidoreductase [Aestuariirhabdus haliotis]MCL6417615.1 molybdopterin-dependent oxidoreductase [Aestuariirhabdus haliotis]MCL6421541.1 molybdopterin-dependent oxidoreductase [Aestuariirhabdus haliotis]